MVQRDAATGLPQRLLQCHTCSPCHHPRVSAAHTCTQARLSHMEHIVLVTLTAVSYSPLGS